MKFVVNPRHLSFVLGPLLGVVATIAMSQTGHPSQAATTAGITLWVATWWVFEPIPIPATSLIPFAAFPLAGVLTNKTVATAYGHWLIILLLGGFILSTAMEKCGVHRRLALGMIRLVGGNSPQRLILGFMLATALCSGWISNTATTLMMLPIAMAILEHTNEARVARCLLLGIAYAASIGGLATPIGTPPNVVLIGVYHEVMGVEIGFLQWMKLGIPTAVTLLLLAWYYLTHSLRRSGTTIDGINLPDVGELTSAERRVLLIFGITALAWMTRTQPFGGWSGLLGITGIGDDTVALAAVVALFVTSDGSPTNQKLLDWESARKIPWGLLILFGGGIAIAKAFGASGLSEVIGQQLTGLTTWNKIGLIGAICLCVTFLTEITSNTATTTLLMPILAATAVSTNMDPLLLMVPAALSASCAFMLPVATAPNAIVFGTGRVTTRDMALAGVGLNFLGAITITIMCWMLL